MPVGSDENEQSPYAPHSSVVSVLEQRSELVETESPFLQKIRFYWQLGEWAAIEALSEQSIETMGARAECALYIAAACFQLGQLEKGRMFRTLASQWGATNQDIGRVLISGVYNNLATVSVLAEGQVSSTAMQHFVTSAEIALPSMAVTSVVKVRTQNQLERLSGSAGSVIPEALQSILPEVNQGYRSGQADTVSSILEEFYLFDQQLKIWRRLTQHEFAYTDGSEAEQRILAAVKSCDDVSVFSPDLLKHQTDWASEYHFSADRANLLRPFANQLRNASVLELGCGCGAITRFLGECGAFVTAVEGSQQRASIAAERCRDLDNVSIVLDKLQDVPFNQQFDVVTLIGVLEYSRIYVEADDPVQFVLEKARSYLKPNGVLLVAIENQLGLKYFAGAPEDHGVGIMAGINDLYGNNTAVTFGKKELERRFIAAGFSKSDTFLPFPDYKLPCLIVHPAGYKNQERFDLSSLLAGTVFYDRQGIANPIFSLESSWPLISRNGLTADLANSHLFVVHNSNSAWKSSEQTLASYYSPKRSAATSQEVVFHLDGTDIHVSRNRLDVLEESKLIATEPYVVGVLHSQLLNKILQRSGWTLDEVERWIQQWLDSLEQVVLENTVFIEGWPEYDKWLPANYIDAIPRNLIINEHGFSQFIDLEWTLPHELPLPLVLYRGLVVTLGTITSIAAPADTSLIQREALLEALMRYCGYSLSDSDYQVFVPLMDALSRKAQGVAPEAKASTTAITLKPFIVRQPVGVFRDGRSRMTLYWRRADTVFCEEHTVKNLYSTNGELQFVKLPLPAQPSVYTRFRLDIAEKQGCFNMKGLKLCNSIGETVWQWNFDIQQLNNVGQLEFYQSLPEGEGICLLSKGSDPQFELDLPLNVLEDVSDGGALIIDLFAYA
ncbi:class I SAM-dependent methyltransferase [Cellvibrio sp. ARAG 10.3]|uniref:class I SAM-dependent methyltransferase n=1 Tax=Cellvibrio sp. ARAG 10.3 TaxID=3451358 RepID=UPI003F464ED4